MQRLWPFVSASLVFGTLLTTFLFQTAADAQPLRRKETSELPKLSITVGAIEAGIRYKLTAESSKRSTSTRMLDYKQTRTNTFDYDFTSTSTMLQNTTSNLGMDLNISFSSDFKVGFGGGVKTVL
jgi:hypothetical protein